MRQRCSSFDHWKAVVNGSRGEESLVSRGRLPNHAHGVTRRSERSKQRGGGKAEGIVALNISAASFDDVRRDGSW